MQSSEPRLAGFDSEGPQSPASVPPGGGPDRSRSDSTVAGFRLTEVRIRNFRGIEDLKLDLDETTVLIGENNSGKTAVLKAIELCLSRPGGSDRRLFDDYDYHLASETASPEDAAPIGIRLRFRELKPNGVPREVQESLAEVLVVGDGGRRQLTLQVTSGYDRDRLDFVEESVFLDVEGRPMKPATAALAADLRRAVPVNFLSALRDAGREFRPRGQFWREFLSARDLSGEDRAHFEAEMAALNLKLIESHPPLREVRARLDRAGEVITFGTDDPVIVDALPSRASALLSQARVNLASRQGAMLPLERQGEGARSLAVLLLFDAYLRRRLGEEGEAALPITILEEPEAHLHPAAVRLLMDRIQEFPGQKIVSTHSGDIVGGLDSASVRRLVYREGRVRAYRADLDSMNEKDRQTFQRMIRRGRGDLLFARCWLLHEGETEAVLFAGVAEAMGCPFDQCGVATVPCADVVKRSLFRLANQFGIPWLLVCDDDEAGRKKYEKPAKEQLGDAVAADIVRSYRDVETLLKTSGFADLYGQRIDKITAAKQAVERMVAKSAPVPKELTEIIEKVIALAAP